MQNQSDSVGQQPVFSTSGADTQFAKRIIEKSGVNLNLCWHCNCCAGGCPFAAAMDHHPNQVIRMVQLGMRESALKSSAIWICVGCHTCSMQCPMAIDMAAVMDALRAEALASGDPVAENGILTFHREVLDSIQRHGRTHKLEIMMRYKLHEREWLRDMDVGLKMLAKRKLDLRPSKIEKIDEVKRLFRPKR